MNATGKYAAERDAVATFAQKSVVTNEDVMRWTSGDALVNACK